MIGKILNQRVELKSHREKDGPFEDELNRRPVLRIRNPLYGGEMFGGALPSDKTGDDGGHQARSFQRLRRNHRDERNGEGERRRRRR